GKPIQIQVVELPAEGQPDPFYDAVGRFRVSTALDKQKVVVGSSVKLFLTIAGAGNLEFLKVPELEDPSGFHTLGRIEKRDQAKVVVTYDLAPQSVSVKGVPAIGWNYFDTTPGVERYVTVKTDPLPLQVEPLEGQATLAPLPNSDDRTVEMGVDDIYDMKSAAGSMPLLMPAPPSRVAAFLAGLLPWGFLFLTAMFVSHLRRRRADVAGQRARGAGRRFQRALAAGTDPHAALVGYVADRLACEPAAVIGADLGQRLQTAGVDAELSDAVGSQVDAGVAARYTGSDGSTLGADSVAGLVQRLEASQIKPLATVLGLCILALGTCMPAQTPSAVGETAYRQGDYAGAAAAFAEQAAGGDRRAAYNLGNSRYRQGRFAEALVAYESARLATPRDPQLLFNIRLTRRKLDLVRAEGEPFLTALAELRDALTPWERLWLCAALNLLAAVLVVLGRRLRAIGIVVALPALLLLLEVAWLGPARPPKGIITVPRVALRAEPKAELSALMTIRAGAAVVVLQEGPAWTRVRLRDREGYLPRESLQVVQ
ncbi:MAG: hypothetical protein V3U11_09615, partial [Planctomycetota bacterium]